MEQEQAKAGVAGGSSAPSTFARTISAGSSRVLSIPSQVRASRSCVTPVADLTATATRAAT